MTNDLTKNSQAVLVQLNQLVTETPPSSEDTIKTARQWIEAIENTQTFLADKSHNIAFIGTVGVGKSSLIGIAANLLAGPTPTDRTSLKNNSVLAIGSGRTTVCEVHIRAGRENDKGPLGLVIEPSSVDEMKKEIEIYAENEWRRRQPEVQRGGEDDSDPTTQEIQRFIRGMTGYVELQESCFEGKIRKRRKIDPLDTVVAEFQTASQFVQHLLDRSNLAGRTSTDWWWSTVTADTLKELKLRFESINHGIEPTVMLPRKMTVVVPEPFPDEEMRGFALTFIDTRGMDGPIESRADLQTFLRDSRSIIVICATFKDAPGEAIRGLFRSMTNDAELREAIPRTLLVLLDQGDAEQVNGAEGDREFGQEIKIDECHIALEGIAASRSVDKTQIIAFDTLKDDRARLLEVINAQLCRLRQAFETQLNEQVESAWLFIRGMADVLRPKQQLAVDEKLKEVMALHRPQGMPPLRDPLQGLFRAINETRYASVVYATCRRNGGYFRLNLYAAVRAEASRAATAWLDDLVTAIIEKLVELEQDRSFAVVQDNIRLRKRVYQDAHIKLIRTYAEEVGKQVENSLKLDKNIWGMCCSEWGQGDGFKNKVLNHLENWSRRQQSITAHEIIDIESGIPLLGEISRPTQSPNFTLNVRNIRALRQVAWTPTPPLSVIVGANGAGKTTLLQTLRLLRVAYEHGLPDAVAVVLGGSSNFRSWGAGDEEPVEIGINIGEASWRIKLTPKSGTVDYLADECLLENGHEIFSRDSLGTFLYGEERIEPTTHLGLRTLMDRGSYEPGLRAIAKFIQHIKVCHDPDLWTLRRYGSNTSDDRFLNSRGTNALALLRRWFQDRTNNHRYQFVCDGLRAAFPNTFDEIDFVEAGSTLAARIYPPYIINELSVPLADEANGVLQLLVLFCFVASATEESVIAIDEPENSLHPYALRVFLRRTERWAKQHNLTVLLATHSTVLLDELTGRPEQIYVMKSPASGKTTLTRLDQLCDIEWLKNFKLGDLYEEGEIGSNEDEV